MQFDNFFLYWPCIAKSRAFLKFLLPGPFLIILFETTDAIKSLGRASIWDKWIYPLIAPRKKNSRQVNCLNRHLHLLSYYRKNPRKTVALKKGRWEGGGYSFSPHVIESIQLSVAEAGNTCTYFFPQFNFLVFQARADTKRKTTRGVDTICSIESEGD